MSGADATAPGAARLRVDGARIMRRIAALARLTEPDRPYTRRAFTDLYLEGREWLEGEFRQAGLDPRLDAGANLVGERPGRRPGLGALTLGSHTDTVPGGGRFDGIAGVVCALEVAQVLNESGVRLEHPLRVVDFLSEEPSDYGASCVGSRAMVGTLTPAMLAKANAEGEPLADAIARMGGRPAELTRPLVAPGEVAAFLELHIEQGPVLESRGLPIGVVGGIVGIQRFQVVVTGAAGHAGTLPMDMRADALVGAARCSDLVWREAQAQAAELPFVATIGKFDVYPNGANVVPGRVELVLEARSLRDDVTAAFLERVIGMGRRECEALRLAFDAEPLSSAPAVVCDPAVREALVDACRARGHGFVEMNSGAGHDAMQVAAVAPVGMVFVPCRGGISHNPAEEAQESDLVAGAEVLLDAVLALDQRLGEG